MNQFREFEQKLKYYVPNMPDELCRCHDLTGLCGRNNQCRRWLQRNTGGRHAGNLLTLDALGECVNFLDVNSPCTTTAQINARDK